MSAAPIDPDNPFLDRYQSYLSGVLRWPELDELWERVGSTHRGKWFVYAVGETPPDAPASGEQLDSFLSEINQLLHAEHEEDYCGIVYTDDRDAPSLVKIYDPNNLGVVCGFSETPTLPGWVLSLHPPVDLNAAFPPPGNRQRWWKRLFG